MQEMFKSMSIGLVIAVVTIMVMLTAYFESPRLALSRRLAPCPVCSPASCLILYVTGTSLNIESFMGSIMCIGVSLSNSVMMVSFIARDWRHGKKYVRCRLAWRSRTTASDSHDCLRDDGRHGSDGAGFGARQRNAGPARPGRYRRSRRFDICYTANRAVGIRATHRQSAVDFTVRSSG